MPVVTLVTVKLAVGEFGTVQQVLNEHKRLFKGLIALHHRAGILLMRKLLKLMIRVRHVLDQLPEEHENHAGRRTTRYNLCLVRARDTLIIHGGGGVAGMCAMGGMSAKGAMVVMAGRRSKGSLIVHHRSM
jgi:hypothetical protein